MAAAIAFLLPSGPEVFVILIVGIMLFGRRLPEVGRTVGKTVVQLRQGFQKFKADIDLDEDMREMRDTLRETGRELDPDGDLSRVSNLPRVLADPARMLTDLTDEALAAPGPPQTVPEPVPESLFERKASDPA